MELKKEGIEAKYFVAPEDSNEIVIKLYKSVSKGEPVSINGELYLCNGIKIDNKAGKLIKVSLDLLLCHIEENKK